MRATSRSEHYWRNKKNSPLCFVNYINTYPVFCPPRRHHRSIHLVGEFGGLLLLATRRLGQTAPVQSASTGRVKVDSSLFPPNGSCKHSEVQVLSSPRLHSFPSFSPVPAHLLKYFWIPLFSFPFLNRLAYITYVVPFHTL